MVRTVVVGMRASVKVMKEKIRSVFIVNVRGTLGPGRRL